jgi:hypothetical protein
MNNQSKLKWQAQTRLEDYVKVTEEHEDRDIPAYGSDITSKGENNLRVALQNINGLSNNAERVAIEEVDSMDQLGIDLMALLELNLNMTLEQRLKLATEIYLKFQGGRSITSSMHTGREGYQPGGTAMIARGPICGRVYRRGSDKMGRFTWMALRGRNGKGLIVTSVYRVCQTKGTKAGENTAYLREWEMLREMGHKDPDPRNIVLDDVSEILHEWGDRGYHPLVLIDANASIDEKHFSNFVKQHGLKDLVAETNDGEPPRTYSRGSRKIDFALGDQYVMDAVVKSGALALHEGVCFSGHTLQFIDFDCKKLF